MEAEAIPVGLTPQEFSDTQFRLEEIESVLKTRFAADDKFCSQYFEAQVGCCHLVSGTCRKHVPNPPSLPPGFMCAHEYGVRLSHNKTAMDEKKSAKATCKRALDALQTEGTHLLQQGSSQSGDANSQGDLSSTSDPATRGGVSDQVSLHGYYFLCENGAADFPCVCRVESNGEG